MGKNDCQQVYQQNINNSSAAAVHPSNRWYSFEDLPEEIREKLLTLQNTGGDFLKIGTGNLCTKIFFLVGTLVIFLIYISVLSGIGSIYSYVFVAGCSIILMWLAFFVWKIYQTAKLPAANNMYLTPTQVIQVEKGLVRYRELFDVSLVDLHTDRGRKGGSNNYLNLRFKDNDSYCYPFTTFFSTGFHEARQWQEKAMMWQKYAINALQNADAAYFASRNVFPGLEKLNIPIRKRSSNFLPVFILLTATFVLPVFVFAGVIIAANRRSDQEAWNSTVAENSAAAYQRYLKFHDKGAHLEEAARKADALYDEAAGKVKQNQANTFDPNGVEAVLNLLENARASRDGELRLAINDQSSELSTIDLQKKIAAQFTKIFNAKTLVVIDATAYSTLQRTYPLIEIEIGKQPEPAKSLNKTAKKIAAGQTEIKKYDFKCTIKVPGKTDYSFELKAATADEFGGELAKRLGLV